jgi:hypothetical protein
MAILPILAVVADVVFIFGGTWAIFVYADALTKPVELLLPLIMGIAITDLFQRVVRGWGYLRILPMLLWLAFTGQPLRISFATLICIPAGDRYLLVRSRQVSNQVQPVGGVLKFFDRSIKSKFYLKDDNSFATQYNDELRLQFKRGTVWAVFAFLEWFDSRLGREISPDREFVEELLDTNLLPKPLFERPRFEYIKRVVPKITWGAHFKIHELFLFEIFHLVPSDAQKQELERLAQAGSTTDLAFLTAETICREGYDPTTSATTKIGSQTKHII